MESASLPASRTCSASRTAACAGSATSMAGNGQTFDTHGWRVGAITKDEIARGSKTRENIGKVSGDRDLADRIRAFAVLDPEPGSAPAVVAGHQIDAHADHVGHVEAVV